LRIQPPPAPDVERPPRYDGARDARREERDAERRIDVLSRLVIGRVE
jgi:hypothetical protein